MPHTPAKFTQADIGRAIREMMKAFGSAQVVFDPDGCVRVIPLPAGRQPKQTDDYADAEF